MHQPSVFLPQGQHFPPVHPQEGAASYSLGVPSFYLLSQMYPWDSQGSLPPSLSQELDAVLSIIDSLSDAAAHSSTDAPVAEVVLRAALISPLLFCPPCEVRPPKWDVYCP